MQVRDMGNTGMEESWYKKQVRLTKAPNFPEGDCNGNQQSLLLRFKVQELSDFGDTQTKTEQNA